MYKVNRVKCGDNGKNKESIVIVKKKSKNVYRLKAINKENSIKCKDVRRI